MYLRPPFLLSALFAALVCQPASAQELLPRDPRALAVLQQSILAMGGAVPADSVASGSVRIVEGSSTETGTIRILTRGTKQTLEDVQTTGSRRMVTYTSGVASEGDARSSKLVSLELAVTSQSACFPLPLLMGILDDQSMAYEYMGTDQVNRVTAHRIRFWKSFASNPKLQHLAGFSVKEIWIDATSGLPHKLAYERRAGRGAQPGIPVEITYSEYRNVSGVLYPLQIHKSLNGTPWVTITIDSVSLNTGLSDSDFRTP